MEWFRGVYDWATEHASIAFDVFTLFPVTAPFAPLLKIVLGVAILPKASLIRTDERLPTHAERYSIA
ncbi:hypothetical protein RQP46_003991 [Phenoliferia psychrophenolica]